MLADYSRKSRPQQQVRSWSCKLVLQCSFLSTFRRFGPMHGPRPLTLPTMPWHQDGLIVVQTGVPAVVSPPHVSCYSAMLTTLLAAGMFVHQQRQHRHSHQRCHGDRHSASERSPVQRPRPLPLPGLQGQRHWQPGNYQLTGNDGQGQVNCHQP